MNVTAQQLLEFVTQSHTALAHFCSIVKEFSKGAPIEFTAPDEDEGPRRWTVGEKHALKTTGISVEDLDKLVSAEADEAVKAKFRSFVHGLIVGMTIK